MNWQWNFEAGTANQPPKGFTSLEREVADEGLGSFKRKTRLRVGIIF
jgi:hypothetical protein